MTGHFFLEETSRTALKSRNAQRRFLLLQGPVGPFFDLLAQRLQAGGDRVHRILFNGGDRLFWRQRGAVAYRDTLERWPEFCAQRLNDWQITDVVLFGDCRPLHRIAVRLASLRELRVHCFEEGYLRPNWVTLERGGVNGHSPLPRHANWFRDAVRALPAASGERPVISSFQRRAWEDVMYNTALVLGGWRYRGYRTHRPWHPMIEYAAGARRFFGKSAAQRRAGQQIAAILSDDAPFYLFPLQLDADSQIRFHSPFGRIAPAIEAVVASFARAAPPEARLIVTEHPLDNGVLDHRVDTRRAAAAAGVSGRVSYLRGGSPDALVRQARGLVTINSTIGLLALGFGIKVKALGDAIYDLPELSFPGELDAFWRSEHAPCAVTFDAFRRVVAAHAQVNGGFYSKHGVALAVENAVARLTANLAPMPAAASIVPGDVAWPAAEIAGLGLDAYK